MKHKNIVPILVPILLALFFLSLPLQLNSSIRDRGALYFSAFWRLIHPANEKQVSKEKKEEFANFLAQDAHTAELYTKQGQAVLKELTHHMPQMQKILVGKMPSIPLVTKMSPTCSKGMFFREVYSPSGSIGSPVRKSRAGPSSSLKS